MQHINSFNKGMVRGIDYTISPQASYLYMLNGCLISRDDKGFVVTAIKGTQQIALFDALEVPIGSTVFNGIVYIITHRIVQQEPPKEPKEYICVYSYKGSNGSGWVDTTEIIPNGPDGELVIPQELLGYGRDKLLEVFAKEGYNGSVDLYICDGLSPNAVINTGIDRDGYLTDRLYTEFVDKVQFLLHKSIVKAPEVKTSIGNTGNLKPGTYFFYIRYEDDTLNATPFIKEVGPITIHAGSTESNNAVGVANMDDAKVSKNILFNIVDADPLYRFVSVGVVYYYGIDGILSRENFLIDKSYPLLDGTAHIVFDGDNGLRSLTVEEIVSDNIQYNISETHLQHEDRYLGANWKGGDIDYTYLKKMARRIIPRAVLHSENNFNKVHDENVSENEYMENEIYPFGVSFLIDGRYKTPVFPVGGWEEGATAPQPVIMVPDIVSEYVCNMQHIYGNTARFSFSFKVGDIPYQKYSLLIAEEYIGRSQELTIYDDDVTIHDIYPAAFDPTDKEFIEGAVFVPNLSSDQIYLYRPYFIINGVIVYQETKTFSTPPPSTPPSLAPPSSQYRAKWEPEKDNFIIINDNVYEYLDMYDAVEIDLTLQESYIDDQGHQHDIGEYEYIYGGIVYGESSNPTVDDNKIEVFDSFGQQSLIVDGLEDKTYYFRPYYITDNGIVYGEEQVLDRSVLIILDTTISYIIEEDVLGIYSKITYGENYTVGVSSFGICYSLIDTDPDIDSDDTLSVEGIMTSFNDIDDRPSNYFTQLNELEKGERYYVRAYARHPFGVIYGDTIEIDIPL